jgi:methylated-DNA-[protein]-cysteine S-methyltransferase
MIEFDVIPTPIGPCTAQVDGGHLIGLILGPAPVEAGRRRRLPEIRRSLAAWFRGEPSELPLRVEASAFTRKVYEVVQAIPWGETRTYGEVAAAAGAPGGARAVGNALGRNRHCLFIPCHRVVASGGLGGFSGPGGLEQKKALLALERAKPSAASSASRTYEATK